MHQFGAEAGQIVGQPDEGHVDQSFTQRGSLLTPVIPPGHHSHSGMTSRELGPCPGGEFTRTARLEPDPQHARLTAPVPLGGGGHPFRLADREQSLGDDLPAGVGRGHTPGVPVEEPNAQFGFEALQRVGQGRLADVQPLCGPSEVLLVGDHGEVVQLTQLHAAIINRLYGARGALSWTAPGTGCNK